MSELNSNEKQAIEMADAILEVLVPPSPYRGVTMLIHAADYCAARPAETEQDERDWVAAADLLNENADFLDFQLLADFEHSFDEEPDHDDSVKFCPSCERPNQFGELCSSCQREEDEAEAEAQRWHDEREPESGRYFAS